MNKHMFMFWDKDEKKIVDSKGYYLLGVLGNSGDNEPSVFTCNQCPDDIGDRYTPLRCAQHAPLLEDETGEARQLMEGDVLETQGGRKGIVIFRDDGLLFYVPGDDALLMSTSGPGESVTWAVEDFCLKGNAITTPSLVSGWDTLPDWPLLKSRMDEWNAAQVEVDPAIELIKEDIATAEAYTKLAIERLAQLEESK